MSSVFGQWFGLSSIVRRLVVATMLLALFAAVAPAFGPSARAQDESPAAGPVTVQALSCPFDYAGTDYLDDCSSVGRLGVTLTDPAGTRLPGETDDQGGISFDGGAAGDYSLEYGLLGEGRASFYYACFDGADVFLFDGSSNVIDFSLAEGASVFCRVYVTLIPFGQPSVAPEPIAPANAAFQVFTCPVEYAGDDYLTDCAPVDPSAPVDVLLSPGAEFDLDTALTGTTGAEGRTLFEALDPGTYSAAIDVSERVNTFYYACFDASSGAEEFLFDGESTQFTADIAAGGLLSCRWYIIPTDLGTGSDTDLNIQVFTCPEVYEGAADYLDDCEPVAETDPVDVLLNAGQDLDPDTAQVQSTDAEGRVSFLKLDQGGQYVAGLDIPESETLTQYFCYDTISGEEELLVNGEGNVIPLQLSADVQIIRCDWFVSVAQTAPSASADPSASAPSASPSAAASVTPSARPSASARPGASGGPVATLPSTGTGGGDTSGWSTLPLVALVVVALAAGTVTVARRPGIFR